MSHGATLIFLYLPNIMSRCSDDMNFGSLTFESLEYAQANAERVRQSQPDISVIRQSIHVLQLCTSCMKISIGRNGAWEVLNLFKNTVQYTSRRIVVGTMILSRHHTLLGGYQVPKKGACTPEPGSLFQRGSIPVYVVARGRSGLRRARPREPSVFPHIFGPILWSDCRQQNQYYCRW